MDFQPPTISLNQIPAYPFRNSPPAICPFPKFPLVIMGAAAYVKLSLTLLFCLQAVPRRHLLGSCHAHLWVVACRGYTVPEVLEVNSFQNIPIFLQPPQHSMGNRSLNLYFKVFTLLRLRNHFLCWGEGRVWSLLF